MSKGKKTLFSILMILVMVFSLVGTQSGVSYAAGTKIKLQNTNYPTQITKGSKYYIKGKIVSNKKMKRVEIGIVYASNNKWTKYKYDNKKVKAKTFNIGKADSKVQFRKLSAGTYYYRIYAHTSDGAKLLLNKKFTVVNPAAKTTTSKTTTTTTNKTTTTSTPVTQSKTVVQSVAQTTPSTAAQGVDTVVLSAYNYPVKYNVGTKYNINGRITSKTNIKRVEIGIVVTATNKWTQYKFDRNLVNTKTFDLSAAASTLRFDQLPGGKFTYRIYVHTDNGIAVALNQHFEVVPTGSANKAISWATSIANNDQYTYGKGYGGYFTCPVCAKKTTKKSDTQFTCMPFLAAAYAHGTGDAKLMNGGRHIMNLHDGNFCRRIVMSGLC